MWSVGMGLQSRTPEDRLPPDPGEALLTISPSDSSSMLSEKPDTVSAPADFVDDPETIRAKSPGLGTRAEHV